MITANTNACAAVGTVYNYSYTGAAQTFTAPCEGNYKVELWGAQGANDNGGVSGGKGAYVAGTVTLNKNTQMYVYVGYGITSNAAANYGNSTIFNGGTGNSGGWNGGGATDIRVTSGAWDNSN